MPPTDLAGPVSVVDAPSAEPSPKRGKRAAKGDAKGVEDAENAALQGGKKGAGRRKSLRKAAGALLSPLQERAASKRNRKLFNPKAKRKTNTFLGLDAIVV